MRGLRHRSAQESLGAPGIAGSAVLHGLVVATFVAAGGLRSPPRLPPVYRVNLVSALGSPPAAAAPAATAPAAAKPQPPAPKPAHARPEPRKATPAVPLKPAPRPAPVATAPTPAPRTAPAKPAPSAPPAPASAAAAPTGPVGTAAGAPGGTDVATIKTEGVEFPFPGYLHNLVAQVYRRWRPPSSSARLEAEVFFIVHRDGSVTGLEFITRSGSFAFDLEAQGAVEAAARAGAFGTLPAGYGPDALPVSFFFNPRSAQ